MKIEITSSHNVDESRLLLSVSLQALAVIKFQLEEIERDTHNSQRIFALLLTLLMTMKRNVVFTVLFQ